MNMDFINDDYRVNLDIFEGPLDLLLYLIKKNDLDVYDIPIAFVLEEYMRYLDTLKELDIDLAGEFLFMAAELAHIKSRLLLPDDAGEEEETEEDPRADLVRRLLEYQQFKEASNDLLSRKMLGRDVFTQQAREKVADDVDGPVEGNVYELIEAFSKVLENVPSENFHDVAVDRISVNERIYQIIGMMKKGMTKTLEEILGRELTRYNIVVTFLAMLEMCRLRMIKVYQTQMQAQGQIHIQCVMDEVKEEDVARLVELETSGLEAKPLEDENA
jgi:segregation and condensation protein A